VCVGWVVCGGCGGCVWVGLWGVGWVVVVGCGLGWCGWGGGGGVHVQVDGVMGRMFLQIM